MQEINGLKLNSIDIENPLELIVIDLQSLMTLGPTQLNILWSIVRDNLESFSPREICGSSSSPGYDPCWESLKRIVNKDKHLIWYIRRVTMDIM